MSSSSDDFGRGNDSLSFGARAWMPAVTIDGRDYSLAYEDMTEDHLKGIPVRRDGRTIGHIKSLKEGMASIQLNEGETLDLDQPKLSVSVGNIGFVGQEMEATMLESLDTLIRPVLVREMPQGGYYEGTKR